MVSNHPKTNLTLSPKTLKGHGNLLVVKNIREYIKFCRNLIEETIIYKIFFPLF